MRDPRYPSHSEPPLNKGLLEDFVRDKRLFVSHSPFRVYVYKNCIIIRFDILLFHSACKPDFAGYKPGLSSKETPTFLSLSAILEQHAYIRSSPRDHPCPSDAIEKSVISVRSV